MSSHATFRIAPLTLSVGLLLALTHDAAGQAQQRRTPPFSGAMNNGSAVNSQIRQQSLGFGFSGSQFGQQIVAQGRNSMVFNNLGVNPSSFTTAGAVAPSRPMGPAMQQAPTKPFSNVNNGPTVSPYLNLFGNGIGSSDFNYQTLVRPMMQQQDFNRQLQQQQQVLNRRFQQMQSQPAFDPRGSQSMYPTGHPTAFRNLSRFYPSAGDERRR